MNSVIKCAVTLFMMGLFSTSHAQPPSADAIKIELSQTLGSEISDFKNKPKDPESPLPKSYQVNIEFTIQEVSPKGGHFFICTKKQYCDAIFAYYDMLKGLAGPYVYQSKSGLVVAQLNSGLSVETAEKIEAVIDSF